MESRRVLITGCGRSGTKYTAVALSALGFQCSHEVVFHPDVLGDSAPSTHLEPELHRLVPAGSSAILLNSDRENARVVDQRLLLPFLEKAGQYWGLPSSDSAAIDELERLRGLGAEYFVVSSEAVWFLKHYGHFSSYLEERHPLIYRSSRYQVFGLKAEASRARGGVAIDSSFYWPSFIRGEASWVAAPYLASLPTGSIVLHQVRHPIAVIRSFGRMGFFAQNEGPFRRFAENHCPTVANGTVLERLMSYWLDWNLIVERTLTLPGLIYHRYRIEDMSPTLMNTLCRYAEFEASGDTVESTLAALPTNFHTRGSKVRDHEINWDTLPNPALTRRLKDLADHYGYAVA